MKSTLVSVTLLGLITLKSTAGDLNSVIVDTAKAYPDKGGYDTTWKSSGTPEAVVFKNAQILAKSTNGTYCSGFTFTVAMKSLAGTQPFATNTVADVRRFQQNWYGANEASKEKQCVTAAEKLGVGKEVVVDEARPGDFVQFWRTNSSGHSAVFLGWVTNTGNRVGLKYRSSQGSTEGIGDTSERFDGKGGKVIPNRMYFCRLATK